MSRFNGGGGSGNGNVKVDTTNLATKTELQAVASGSPKGVYATLTALQTAFPTGNTNIYLVTADGSWYYWSGSSWTAGGVYQSTILGDNTITPEKTTFIQKELESLNIFDKSKTTAGGYFLYTTGVWSANAGFVSTDFIAVTEGQTYTHEISSHVTFYNSQKQFVSGVFAKPFTIPTGQSIQWMRVTIETARINTEMVVKGTVFPLTYIPYKEVILIPDLKKFNEDNVSFLSPVGNGKYGLTENITVTMNQINQAFTRSSMNLIDLTKLTPNTVLSLTTGLLSASGTYSTTDFIPVIAGKTYTQSLGTSYKVFYDSNKNFVSGINASNPVAPENASYIRSIILNTLLETVMMVEGTAIPAKYESYHTYGLANSIKPNASMGNPLMGLKLNALGDSITQGIGGTKAWHTFIAERTGMVARNYGVSGTLLTAKGGRTDSMVERYTTMDNDADIILVFGGTNDHTNTIPIGAWGDTVNTTVYGAVRTLIEGLTTKYVGKRIGFILPTPKTGNMLPTSGLANYVNAIKDACERQSIPTLNLYTGSGIIPDFQASKDALMPDGLHPNNAGYEFLSRKIERFLLTL